MFTYQIKSFDANLFFYVSAPLKALLWSRKQEMTLKAAAYFANGTGAHVQHVLLHFYGFQ